MAPDLKIRPADWFDVDWREVWGRTGLAPDDCPGVVCLNERTAKYRVHRTHLPLWAGALFERKQTVVKGLYPHQNVGVNFIQGRRGTLLADEQRTGKTATIVYAHEPTDGPLFVIGPLAARAPWHEWAARRFGWCGQVHCSICARVDANNYHTDQVAPSFVALNGRQFDGNQIDRAKNAYVIFCHYAVIQTWAQLFAEFRSLGTLAIDEAHLAGIQQRKSVTMRAIATLATVADKRVAATGTPLFNKPRGLFPLLDFLAPTAFGDFWSFARRYCDAAPTAHGWQANGLSNSDELKDRLSQIMLRRTWNEIAGNLPPITRVIETVALSDGRRDEIENLAAKIRSASGTKTAVGDLAKLRLLYAKEKTAAAVAKALELLDERKSIVIWAWHREVAAAITDELKAKDMMVIGPIHGDVPPDERERMIQEAHGWAGYDTPLAFVATMASLATAVSLSFADTQIFAELDWTPATISQAEMRPFDGKKPISSIYLVADCDSDQRLADALLSKLGTASNLGLRAGVGDTSEILGQSLGINNQQTLAQLAASIIDE